MPLVWEKSGHLLIGARKWIPRERIEDPVTSLVMGLPLDLEFRAKGQLAMDICADCLVSFPRLLLRAPSTQTDSVS